MGRQKWDGKEEVGLEDRREEGRSGDGKRRSEDRREDGKEQANVARASLTGGLVAVAGRTPIAVESDCMHGEKLS